MVEDGDVFFVPGRVELVGKHTDYCGGRSLVCTLDRGISMRVAHAEGRVTLRDGVSGEIAAFDPDADLRPIPGHWSNYPMTVVRRIRRDFPGVKLGMDARFRSNLPKAAGLSSSSALVVATFQGLLRTSDLARDPAYRRHLASAEEVAAYLGAVESGKAFGPFAADGGVGTSGGSQDHAAILLSRTNQVLRLSFSPLTVEGHIPFPSKWRLLVGQSGVVAEKTGGAMGRYNRLSARAATLLAIWNARTDRNDPTLATAMESEASAADRLRRWAGDGPDGTALVQRLDHFILESGELVPAAAEAILRADGHAMGAIAARSQAAAERLLGNQVDETMALVSAARDAGALAASAFGAGFGGSAWAIAPVDEADGIALRWMEEYRRRVAPTVAARARAW